LQGLLGVLESRTGGVWIIVTVSRASLALILHFESISEMIVRLSQEDWRKWMRFGDRYSNKDDIQMSDICVRHHPVVHECKSHISKLSMFDMLCCVLCTI
jgi:hypothetical protein